MMRLGLIVVALLALLGWSKYEEHRGYEQCRAEMQEASLKLALAYAEKIKQAQEERDANQVTIDNLLAHARSVRIHIPVCETPAKPDQNGASGVLSQRVDESFARFQERTGELLKRCDELNLDAIKANRAQ